MNNSNGTSGYCYNNTLVYNYVYNLTSSYADQRNEATMVATSVIMFTLAALFFNLNLFSPFSDISAILNPSVRLFLSTSLSLFLPVMSYLFSEAKKEGAATGQTTELSLRARTILMWMLLVELLRKKVEAVLVGAPQGYSGIIERAARIGWLGYLVFYNLRSAGKKALYGILWVLAAAKLVQRFVTLELAKRSFAYGKNPQLVASYMAQMLEEERQHAASGGDQRGSALLKLCNYVVTGEEDLEKEAGPDGYQLVVAEPSGRLAEAIKKDDSTVVTVGRIWELAGDKNDKLLNGGDPRLKRLCLSFTLYKLLRRRLEDLPITDAEARNCRHLIFRGLCEEEEAAKALFQVFGDEVQFLCEHYHSVHPVVLASPFFFLVNYILFPVVVWALCALTIVLCSNGDVGYAYRSFKADNYAVWFGVVRMGGCILRRVTKSPMHLFSVVDVSITALLLLSVVYEEVWEFIVFLLSNWFMVSLLSSYASSSQRWRDSPLLRGVIRSVLWVRTLLSGPSVRVKQLSLLWCCGRLALLPTRAVPVQAKKALMERLMDSAAGDGVGPHPSNLVVQSGETTVQLRQRHSRSRAGIAEVILAWHIATELLESRHPLTEQTKAEEPHRKVATALSRYCAYLVAFQPALLPDDKDGTERVYKDTMAELKSNNKALGCWGYHVYPPATRSNKLMAMAAETAVATDTERKEKKKEATSASALHEGARLGKALVDTYGAPTTDVEQLWKQLADLWTEVLVYAAPTGSEVHLKAHREALAQGGEFITVLWAIATHTGIGRGPAVATPPA